MPSGGFIGFAPLPRSSGNAGTNSIFLTPLTALQNGIATAVLLDAPSATSSISFKALIYDGAHSALLASGSTATSVGANYNRFPLTANLNLTAGTTYYVGYVCANSLSVSIQTSGPGAWFVSGGQSVASPANPLVGGASNTSTLMVAVELDGTGSQGFGFSADYTSGTTLSTSNTLATLSSAASQGARSILTQSSGSGKYYAEIDVGGTIGGGGVLVGIASANCPIAGATTSNTASYYTLLSSSGNRTGNVSLGLSFVSGDTIGIAYDAVNNFMWWNKNNGSWFGASSSAGNPVTPAGGLAMTAANWPLTLFACSAVPGGAATFGLRETAGNLRYTPPAGFSPWSAATYPAAASAQARVMVMA